MRKGIATLVPVLIVMMISLFVILTWESRLMLAIQRNQSLNDVIAVSYAAESEIYDWIAKFQGSYPGLVIPDNSSRQLDDGTTLNLAGSHDLDTNTDTLRITAKRTYSTTDFLLSRQLGSTEDLGVKNLEIALSLDCTTSMNEPAISSCTHNCSSRMNELKKAALSFAESVKQFAADHSDKNIKLGLNVFRVDAKWEVEPTTDIDSVISAITNGLGNMQNNSLMCNAVSGSTSIGSGFDLSTRYLRTSKIEDQKQVMVLVSDGEPNSRHESYTDTAVCGNVYCNFNCNSDDVTENPIDYMKCTLQTVPDGIRDPDTDAYVVTVLDSPPGNVTDVFGDSNLVKHYYNSGNATELSGFLDSIFSEITSGFLKINFQKILPEP